MGDPKTDMLLDLVNCALQLAVCRHDLMRDDDGLDEGEVHDIAVDVVNAMQGINTCAEEPCEEFTRFQAMLAAERKLRVLECKRCEGTGTVSAPPSNHRFNEDGSLRSYAVIGGVKCPECGGFE